MSIHPNTLSILSWLMFCDACRTDAIRKILTVVATAWKEQEDK